MCLFLIYILASILHEFPEIVLSKLFTARSSLACSKCQPVDSHTVECERSKT